MTDTIEKNQPNNASTVHMTVIPSADGMFIFKSKARAEGTGHGSPVMWLDIFINGTKDKGTGDIGWQDGPAQVEVTTAEPLKKGEVYDVLALSGNRNAKATGIEIEGRRV